MQLRQPTQSKCQNCGTPYTPKGDEKYCCQGCAFVHHQRKDRGFEHFYELKGQTPLPPVGSRVFQNSDFAWLEEAIASAEASSEGAVASSSFRLGGISCVGCVWQVEALFNKSQGAVEVRIDVQAHRIEIIWEKGLFDCVSFATQLKELGYTLSPEEKTDKREGAASSRLARRLGLCGAFLLNTMLFTLPSYLGMDREFFLTPLFEALAALFATLSLIFGGSFFIKRAWSSARLGVLHIDLPIALGLIAAWAGSVAGWLMGYTTLIYFDFVATFVFLMLGGRWLQEFALEKNQAHLEKKNPAPQSVLLHGGETRLPVAEIQRGTRYLLEPGEVNPVAADLVEDDALISLEWINGEAEPAPITKGKTVPSGAINVGLKSRCVIAREPWAESLLARLLERPAEKQGKTLMQRILQVYLIVVILLAMGGGLVWYFLQDDGLKAVQVVISILVVSCPCALGVALPIADEFAITTLRRAGLFIKHAQIWGHLRQVKVIVFDKTGTLTMDSPELTNPDVLQGLDSETRCALFHLVKDNLHPVAKCLRAALLSQESTWRELRASGSNFETPCEVVGQGVYTMDRRGRRWSLGKPDWLAASEKESHPAGHTHLRVDGQHLATFTFSDDVRDDARECVEWLQDNGYPVAILSGDAPVRVTTVANNLGVSSDKALGACTPADKAAWLDTHAPGSALMIGDGANDSLAFNRAACRGTPVVERNVLESSSDFYFFGRSLKPLPLLLSIARKRSQTVCQLFILAVTYNLIAVSLCLAGMMHPLMAAILMPLSSIATLTLAWARLGR